MTDDPREGPNLSEKLEGKEPRDVLADRIQTWADTEDWHVYDYVDRLLNDLDAAGFDVVHKPPEREEPTFDGGGATLLVAIFMPEQSTDNDPDDAADGLIGALNELRRRADGERLTISLWPDPQWVTRGTLDVLRRAKELVQAERED